MKKGVAEKIQSMPQAPGVYVFYSVNKPLYIGKAANLRARLKSYLKITDQKTEALHEEASRLKYIVLRSEIEALIEESRLIKELKPKYNILWRDDKSYFYAYFTNDVFPKIFIGYAHPRGIRNNESGIMDRIGPFTDGGALRLVLRLLRRQYPYCTCAQKHLRDCLNAQIGKCLGFCCKKSDPSVIAIRQPAEKQSYKNLGKIAAAQAPRDDEEKEYAKNIKMIKAILRGQSKKLLKTLKDAKEREALNNIFQHQPHIALITAASEQAASSEHPGGDLARPVRYNHRPTNGKSPRAKKSLPLEQTYSVFEKQLLEAARIECYDISNFAGKEAVGAMTVYVKHESGIRNYEWVPDKNQWRKFEIKSAPTRDDSRMIAEVLERRLNHPEWPYPDLIIIDGGIAQYRAAKRVIEKFIIHNSRFMIQFVSYAKPEKKIIGIKNPSPELRKLVERAIYQTHNFVIRYHRQRRRKEFLQ